MTSEQDLEDAGRTIALDVILAVAVAFAAEEQGHAAATAVVSLMADDDYSHTEIIIGLIRREAGFVRMVAEGTHQSTDAVIRGDISARRHPDWGEQFDLLIGRIRSGRP